MRMTCLIMAGAASLASANSYVSFGFTSSYSVFGGGYEAEMIDINVGVKRIGYSSNGDFLLSPGISAIYHLPSDVAFISLSSAANIFVRGSDEKGAYYTDFGYLGDAKLRYDDEASLGYSALCVGKRWKFSQKWSFIGDFGLATPLSGSDAVSNWNLVGGLGLNYGF